MTKKLSNVEKHSRKATAFIEKLGLNAEQSCVFFGFVEDGTAAVKMGGNMELLTTLVSSSMLKNKDLFETFFAKLIDGADDETLGGVVKVILSKKMSVLDKVMGEGTAAKLNIKTDENGGE